MSKCSMGPQGAMQCAILSRNREIQSSLHGNKLKKLDVSFLRRVDL